MYIYICKICLDCKILELYRGAHSDLLFDFNFVISNIEVEALRKIPVFS